MIDENNLIEVSRQIGKNLPPYIWEINKVFANHAGSQDEIERFLESVDFSSFLKWQVPPEISIWGGSIRLYMRYEQSQKPVEPQTE